MKKSSFLERLTGAVSINKHDDSHEEDQEFLDEEPRVNHGFTDESQWHGSQEMQDDEPQEGELPVDMYHTGDSIVIRALVAGVSPEDLDIAITRDMVTIKGVRDEYQETENNNYFHRELFWGSFSRTILLPEEVLIDEAEAHEKHGLLEIRLPKIDKGRSTRLKVRANQTK